LRDYLFEIQADILPKSPEGPGRYTLENWNALTRYCEDAAWAIDNTPPRAPFAV
jgi:hypothetical protein